MQLRPLLLRGPMAARLPLPRCCRAAQEESIGKGGQRWMFRSFKSTLGGAHCRGGAWTAGGLSPCSGAVRSRVLHFGSW